MMENNSLSLGQSHWKLDPTYSILSFTLISEGITTAKGKFKVFTCELQTRSDHDFSEVGLEITIDVNSLMGADRTQEEQLKSPSALDAAKYPKITLKLVSMTKGLAMNYDLVVDLTIKGITKRVNDFKAIYDGPIGKVEFNTMATLHLLGRINCSDFGVLPGNTKEHIALSMLAKLKK